MSCRAIARHCTRLHAIAPACAQAGIIAELHNLVVSIIGCWAVALPVLAACTGSAGSAEPAAVPPPPPPGDPCRYPGTSALERVHKWSFGCATGRPSKPPQGEATVLWLGRGQSLGQGTPINRQCARLTSMAVSRATGQLFVAGQGRLFAMPLRKVETRPAPIQIEPRGLRVVRLFAAVKGSRPPILLAAVAPPSSAGRELWEITVRGHRATAAPIASSWFARAAEQFFSRYDTSRCARGDHNCLVVSNRGPGHRDAAVDVEARRAGNTRAFADYPGTFIRDAVWANHERGEILILIDRRCARPGWIHD
ncbi:MAG: hypothetical protein MJE77_27145 [Proteobacteria bacterium]|nr:hypothetical protein [Pseudomonadota bacterium]